MKNHFSATQLKYKISEVLNDVYFKGNDIIIERYGKPIAKIIPVKKRIKKDVVKAWDTHFGILPDFPDVTKYRRSRKEKITL